MLRMSMRRLLTQSLRQTCLYGECKGTAYLPRVPKFYSSQAVAKESSQSDVAEKETEETRIKKSKPMTNTPFIRELFLGRFAKVSVFD